VGRFAWTAVVVASAVTALAGCRSQSHGEKRAVSADGRAVIRDAYDGRLDRDWSCGSLRAAYERLPSDGVSLTLPRFVGRAAAEACDAALATVHVGMTDTRVRMALGRPDRAGGCLLFRWPPADAGQSVLVSPSTRRSPVDGARMCFDKRHVSLLQTAVHG
jgi:hypothetical protein